jgi:flagellar basal-body rod protein FlgC
MDDMLKTLHVAAAGMRAQGARLKVVAENVANANSLPSGPGELPYRRRIVTFDSMLDSALGASTVRVGEIVGDKTPFARRHDPSHPAADAEGYVLAPNVNTLIEMADMREAQRSYEANLNAIRAARSMLQNTIEVLR